jgi:hypothetical protein
MSFVQQKPLRHRALWIARNFRVSFSDLALRLRHQPRADHRIRLRYELGMRVELHLVPSRSDPGLDPSSASFRISYRSSIRRRHSACSASRFALASALAAFIRSR